ncbi:hypothetical protein CBL_21280, partial [Carabus blaptoides fortunei]
MASTEIPIEHLAEMISDHFNGEKHELEHVDSVIKLATPFQAKYLSMYVKVISKGKAKAQLNIHNHIETWNELLMSMHRRNEYIDQLLKELNCLKQENHEHILKFYNRLKNLHDKIREAITESEPDIFERTDRFLEISEITFNRFVNHSHPEISHILRRRDYKTIGQAYAAILASQNELNVKNSNYQNLDRSNISIHNYNGTANYQSMHNKLSKCKYCNKFGHSIEECRKREQKANDRQSNSVNCNNFFHGGPITYDELLTNFAYDFKFPESPTINPRELESSCELPVIVTTSSSSDKIVTEESKQCESNVSAKSNDLPVSHSVINSNDPEVAILNNDSMGTLQPEAIVVLDTINNIEDYQQHESTIVNTNYKNLYLTNLNEQVKPSLNFSTENPAMEIQSSSNVNNISTSTPVVADHTCMELVQKSTSIPESIHLHTP